jgi:hypothetical protein
MEDKNQDFLYRIADLLGVSHEVADRHAWEWEMRVGWLADSGTKNGDAE